MDRRRLYLVVWCMTVLYMTARVDSQDISDPLAAETADSDQTPPSLVRDPEREKLRRFALDDEELTSLLHRNISISNKKDLFYVVKNFYIGLFKNKRTVGWKRGLTRKCDRSTGNCCWARRIRRTYKRDVMASDDERKDVGPLARPIPPAPRRTVWQCSAGESDLNSCCAAVRSWDTPPTLYHPATMTHYTVVQFPPNLYQGYYKATSYIPNNCDGQCRPGTTVMSFLVIGSGGLEMKSFDVPTYYKCQ